MKNYKIELAEQGVELAKIDFPYWESYRDCEIEGTLRIIFRDLGIDMKFCVTNKEIHIDPQCDYMLITVPTCITVYKKIPYLIISKESTIINKVKIK